MKRLLLAVPLVAFAALPALADYFRWPAAGQPAPPIVDSPPVHYPPVGSPSKDDPVWPEPESLPPPRPPGRTEPPPAGEEPAQPELPSSAVRWFPRGIGMPLAPDDPELAGKRVAMLTFDDGPSDSGTTDQILDTLAEENVRALFFITGYGARNNRELVERIHREGHLLAPHSMTHANLSQMTEQMMREEIEPLITLIHEITGSAPRYFRPPFGAYSVRLLDLLAEYELELINWTNGSRDWENLDREGRKDPSVVVTTVMEQLHKGAVILLHDTHQHTAEALPEIIRRIRGEGYEFVMLP